MALRTITPIVAAQSVLSYLLDGARPLKEAGHQDGREAHQRI